MPGPIYHIHAVLCTPGNLHNEALYVALEHLQKHHEFTTLRLTAQIHFLQTNLLYSFSYIHDAYTYFMHTISYIRSMAAFELDSCSDVLMKLGDEVQQCMHY